MGGWLGSIHIVLVKVQSPARRARRFCGSPGVAAFCLASISAWLGPAGGADGFGLSWARTETALQRASRNRTATVGRIFIGFSFCGCLHYASFPRRLPPELSSVKA